ncbi:MAG: hypothetical protein ACKO2F_08480 [Cyanobacteriota bacterium]
MNVGPWQRLTPLVVIGLLATACARRPVTPGGDGPCVNGGRRCAAAAAGQPARSPRPSTLNQERAYPCRNRESGKPDICFDTDLGRRNRDRLGQPP